MSIKLYNLLWKDFVSFHLFDSQRVGTSILTEWTDVALLCCHGKSSSYFPTFQVIRSCSYGYISLKIPMLFYLAFQTECKYWTNNIKIKLIFDAGFVKFTYYFTSTKIFIASSARLCEARFVFYTKVKLIRSVILK